MKIEIMESYNVVSENTYYCIVVNGSMEKCFSNQADASMAVARVLAAGTVEIKKTLETYEVA